MLSNFESMWSGRLGQVNLAKHRITLIPEAKPIYQLWRRAGHHTHHFEREKIHWLLNNGVIERSNSEWASLVVFVKKKDGSVWVFIQYRRRNEVLVRDS